MPGPVSSAITSATITLRFDDGSEHTYEIHEGAQISVEVSNRSNRDIEQPGYTAFTPDRFIKIEDHLHVELHASATSRGPEFVTVTRTPADGEPAV